MNLLLKRLSFSWESDGIRTTDGISPIILEIT